MRRAFGSYEIDDDPARIDPAAAVSFLTAEAYWGRWRGEQEIRQQIAAAWRVTGAYDSAGAMVGFARAFSDGGSAYLSDVYVLPAHRGAGLGRAIVAMMIEDGPGAGWRWMLHTSDAHGLYRSFGFARPARPGTWSVPPQDRGASGGRPPESAQPLAGSASASNRSGTARARPGGRGRRRRRACTAGHRCPRTRPRPGGTWRPP